MIEELIRLAYGMKTKRELQKKLKEYQKVGFKKLFILKTYTNRGIKYEILTTEKEDKRIWKKYKR